MLVSLAGCSGSFGSAEGAALATEQITTPLTASAAESTTTPEMSAAVEATIAAGAGITESENVTGGEPAETEESGESDVKDFGTATDEAIGDAGNGLVVYFSWSGNTESVALEIAEQTGADVFKLEPQNPYTTDYDELLEVAQEEQGSNVRPAIKTRAVPVVIGDYVWIGGGSIILPGVTIGDYAIIGAGSVVTSSIQAHAVAYGNPCWVSRIQKEYQ